MGHATSGINPCNDLTNDSPSESYIILMVSFSYRDPSKLFVRRAQLSGLVWVSPAVYLGRVSTVPLRGSAGGFIDTRQHQQCAAGERNVQYSARPSRYFQPIRSVALACSEPFSSWRASYGSRQRHYSHGFQCECHDNPTHRCSALARRLSGLVLAMGIGPDGMASPASDRNSKTVSSPLPAVGAVVVTRTPLFLRRK